MLIPLAIILLAINAQRSAMKTDKVKLCWICNVTADYQLS